MLERISLLGQDGDIYGLPEKIGEEKEELSMQCWLHYSNGNAVSTEAIGSQEASVTADITLQQRWQEDTHSFLDVHILEVLIQLLFSKSKSSLKCTWGIKVKSIALKRHFCAKITDVYII